MKQEITFDRFVRGGLAVAGIIAAILLINRLSAVLLPFVVAWLIAYLIYPIVLWFEKFVKIRAISIIVTLLALLVVIGGAMALFIPAMIEQGKMLKDIVMSYVTSNNHILPSNIEGYIRNFLASEDFQKIMGGIDYLGIIQTTLSQLFSFVSQTASILFSIFSACIVFLYTFFILLDYEKFVNNWQKLIPYKHRKNAQRIFSNVADRMNAYFRGQSLIAMMVGILFAIGFTVIDLPMGLGLGLFIGVLNLVPYLQTIGIIPAVLLALLKSAHTGQSFWVILLSVALVFLIVQAIQDMVLTPRIMGKMMGLNPAAILLALSVWGSLLGFIGLIIALPLTTIIIAYYRNFLQEDEYRRRKRKEPVEAGTDGQNAEQITEKPAVVIEENNTETKKSEK